jgi:hypothetical protein
MTLPARTPNLFQQILSPKALIVAVVVATVWLFFSGLQIVRSVVAMNPSPEVVGIAVPSANNHP